MRTITLELLRHGPAHNQLLSPLTPYMALCENHSAVTLHVPFEHYQFLFRLNALSYRADNMARNFQLNDTARQLGDLLENIPGLTAESNKFDGTDERLTHLRLILSASELALLPFELALAPNGLPGSGQHLLLQPQMPVCLTREIRRTGDEAFIWPRVPRILLIAAAPPGVGEIPLQAHVLALRKIITPWVKYFDETDEAIRNKRVEDHLVVLPGASIEAVEQICASNVEHPFTHIHILAHGVGRPEGYDTRYYLAMHNAQDPNETDYISGSRLAAALRAAMRPDSNPLARPAVVSLASCDSANVGTVIGAGASIAHALHESGIPLVVASQFPLSFPGSVRLVECLYDGLVWGVDPRLLLYDLRRRLYAQFPDTHDWASLTTYMSLPSDFSQQLPDIQIQQALHSINAAMNHADEATRQLSDRISSKRSSQYKASSPEIKQSLLDEARHRIKNAKVKLERLLERWPAHKGRISGLLASTEKRHAEILFRASQYSQNENDRRESLELLRKSRNYYWDTFLSDRSKSWAVVQFLSLTLVMNASVEFPEHQYIEQQNGILPDLPGNDHPDKNLSTLWSMARLLSTYDINSRVTERSVWAHSNLIELYLLVNMLGSTSTKPLDLPSNVKKLLQEHADTLIDISGRKSFAVYSTRRQVLRYIEWYSRISIIPGSLIELAEDIYERLPEEAEEAW